MTIAGPHTAHPPTHRERKRGSGRERAVSGSDSAQTGLHDFTVSPQNRGKKMTEKISALIIQKHERDLH